ncbi:dihydrofolate reductase [Austwickia chelonae]|uniref:Dihydrofolate reductase n=1 Tax=Austwickia chelonae NBRC 105200 TaxID=1184607 RepID=K6W694_9MICO|nr:dihydrofolate reductase [Austwickia chelonae]GAB77352.1 dihydrofolate reductase [Austwickia chelonae NBRC 105200]SEW08457.1 dihydrofolate reductase [Austwickia chelonae]
MTVADSPMDMTPHPPGSEEIVLVAMVSANRVIGDGHDQPWHLREDQQRFRRMTMGHPLLMGRRTWEAIGRPLPGRPAVVLTRDTGWSAEGVTVAHDPVAGLNAARALPGADRIMVIGGGQVYEALLPFATHAEITEVDAESPGETLFPELTGPDWVETGRDDRFAFAFVTYQHTARTRR